MAKSDKYFDADPVILYRIVAPLAVGTLIIGFWGFWVYESRSNPGIPPDPLTVLYHTSQLLIGHGVHLEHKIPLILHLGRILGIAFIFSVGLAAFFLFFRQEVMLYRLRFKRRKKHVVICGLGDLGLRLANTARKNGKLVVGVEKKEANSSLEQARKSGVLVFEGDATDASMLKKARADKASYVIACCDEDETNIAIVARMETMMRASMRKSKLNCRLLLRSGHLRDVLIESYLKGIRQLPANFEINYRDLDYHKNIARKCLNDFPLDFKQIKTDTKERVHVIIVGFDRMGEEVLLQVARQGHYANAIACESRLKVTLMDSRIQSKFKGFKARYNKIEWICEVDCVPSFNYKQIEASDEELVTIYLCFEKETVDGKSFIADDNRNIIAGVDLLQLNKDKPVQVLVYQSTHAGLSALIPSRQVPGIFPKIGAFGMPEDIYTWDLIIHETQDRMAKMIHENYLITAGKVKGSDSRKPSDEWDNLSEDLQESNRQVSDHIHVKLRTIGIHDREKLPGKVGRIEISDSDVLLLAQMEHKRFCAERWLAGWEYADETDRENKLNSNLKCWDELSKEIKKYDEDQVRSIL